MIFRDKELLIIYVVYELTERTSGRIVQGENKVGILAKSSDDALRKLRQVINKACEIRVNQLIDGGSIHLIADEATNVILGKEKNVKLTEKPTTNGGKKAGRPPGSKNKPKE